LAAVKFPNKILLMGSGHRSTKRLTADPSDVRSRAIDASDAVIDINSDKPM